MMRKQTSTPKRILAFLLVLTTLLGIVPIGVLAAGSSILAADADVAEVIILHEGAEITSLTLAEDGKETLTAHLTIEEYDSRAWQIRIPDTEEWVSISGKSGETLDVTYALVGSMLNESGRADLRHILRSGETVHASEPVEVILSYNTPEGAASIAGPALYATRSRTAMAANTDDDSNQLLSIVINYLFDNGGLAFEPYGATIAKGSDFKASITSPSVMGYKPFRRISADYVDASTVELDLTNVQENMTINVIYEPALVKFSVHHHLQNVNDDEYSLHADYITEGYGLTGSKIPDALTMEIAGFKPLAYEKEITIAADGSTVVEIRYDRNYYLVSFEMAGGYGTDPVYARYGTTVGTNPPTRHGYIFSGWELIVFGDGAPTDTQKSVFDINDGKTFTLPDANLKYLARWATQLTTYTMVFWKENINDNGFTYWGYLDSLSAMSGSLVSGADRIDEVDGITEDTYFTYNDALTDKDVLVEGDGSTIVNVYYTRNRYTITFKATGKCVIEANHTHTREQCYTTVCGASHIHSADCSPTLSCTMPEHTAHTDACLRCDLVPHTHSESCYCGQAAHAHTVNCWNNVGAVQSSAPNGAPRNPEDGQVYRRIFTYYIYIKGSWYRFSGTASSGTVVDPACGYTEEHTHGDGCVTCGFDAEHTHTDACYNDTLHTHGTGCYTYACGEREHTHTDTCYLLNCGMPTGHTHSANCNNANKTNTVKLVYAKYQQNLESIWPVEDGNGVVYDSGERWEPSDSSYFSAVLVFIANMPADDFTLTLSTSSAAPYTMSYYLEVLPGEPFTHTYGGRNYVLYTTIKASYNYITRAEDFFDIQGYTQLTSNPAFSSNQINISGTNRNVSFYYARMTDHALDFSSSGSLIADRHQEGIPYNAPLKDYNFTPNYPANLEEGAYVFGGWYTSPGCYDSTEVDWNTVTMAAGGMLFYAKWVPIVHSLEIYTEYANGEYLGKIGDTQQVNHNHFANAPATNPEKGNYVFQGWFYIDAEDGKEKAFVFTGIPVDQDMKIYAKWSSDVSVRYKIHYVLQKDKTVIGNPTEGVGLAGHNKTFYAKVGTELYAAYQSGYYPLTSSHTVTMSAEVEEHVFTFEYVYVESVPYEVRYVTRNGAAAPPTKEVLDNNLSVVTETFVKIAGMMPDAYQKRLVLSADGTDEDGNGILDSNVITFYYEEDAQHAYYKVVHYIRHIADDGYREYRSEETKGVIGTTYFIDPIALDGFVFNPDKTLLNGARVTVTNNQVSAVLGADGMLVELFYDRANVTYTVNYLESGTNKVLYEQKTGTGLYGGQVLEYAIGLTRLGYTLESDEVKQLHLSFNAASNVINFYYKESTYALKYEIVGTTDGGTLTQTSENVFAVSTEAANGSMPILEKGYKFIGWFLDEACSQPVSAEWVDANGKLTPAKDGKNVWISSRTFYAKIEPNVSSMTIHTYGASGMDAGQVFIYRIQGTSQSVQHIDFTVTVTGNSSVTISDLAVGDYTVTELTDWSYRYAVVDAEKEISLAVDPAKNTVSFSHVRSLTEWLDSNHSIRNIFNSN